VGDALVDRALARVPGGSAAPLSGATHEAGALVCTGVPSDRCTWNDTGTVRPALITATLPLFETGEMNPTHL
jgi:hypothetical protein